MWFVIFSITLILRNGSKIACAACGLDAECANFLKPPVEETEEQFRTHFGHQHPLVLLDNLPADPIFCCVCGKNRSDPTYGCLDCLFFIHRSCFERSWPKEIQHFYHPCLLTLYSWIKDDRPMFSRRDCTACGRLLPQGTAFYGCKRCIFVMDVDCTFWPLPNMQVIKNRLVISSMDIHCQSPRSRKVTKLIATYVRNPAMVLPMVVSEVALRMFTFTNHALMKHSKRSTISVTLNTLSPFLIII
ncbi:hypothetical protein I3760_06G030900 [Carya illinoinensis]|nr:hypothetical protein I3760_06G030900 [Carya illinoinensis]